MSKKILLSLIIAVAMGLSSCESGGVNLDINDPNVYCWEMQLSHPQMSGTYLNWFYTDATTMKELISEAEEEEGFSVVSVKKVNRPFEQCGS